MRRDYPGRTGEHIIMKLHLEKASESYLVGVLLAIAGGYLDVYTYICRGGVFANAQTGNIVLLGINLADHNWSKLLFYMYPILAFMAGILEIGRAHV